MARFATAVAYNESIYNNVEQDIELTQRDITNLNGIPTAPEGLAGDEFLYQDGPNSPHWFQRDKLAA